MIRSLTQDLFVRSLLAAALVLGLSMGKVANAATITLTVDTTAVNGAGDKIIESVSGFRYLVEEDTTYKPELGVQDLESLSFQFHKSHNPVAITGETLTATDTTATIVVPDDKDYFISVLPYNGHSLGGGAISVGTAAVDMNIRVNKYPLPAAQISVWIFEDNNPLNGALDLDELGIACDDINDDGCSLNEIPFTVKLFDAAGQYGMAGGHVTWDIYGNPVGTEYDVNGDVVFTPEGDAVNGFILKPDAEGKLLIKNLVPAKYGVEIVPPAGSGWHQTSTIEGSRTIDAWVKANEPEVFVEFGPPGPHVFAGFIKEFDCVNAPDGNCDPDYVSPGAATGATISGQIVNNHISRSPTVGFSKGELFEGCRIGVNLGIAGRTIVSQPCGDEATFSIENLPGTVEGTASSYSLSIYDDGLNVVIANHPFTVSGTTGNFEVTGLFQNLPTTGGVGVPPATVSCVSNTCDLGQIPVFDWFHYLDTAVFHDTNENGIWDADEPPMNAESSATIIRFRDGRVYKALGIDLGGAAPHEEVFPFFHWLVAEVDFGRYKATGATFITDDGGWDADLQDRGYVAQPQGADACMEEDDVTLIDGCSVVVDPDRGVTRVETGTVLTEAFQGFLGQKNTMLFGKVAYADGENGGISGVAIYAITRAEDDPRYAAAEEWEPGIPRLQLALYKSDVNENIVNGAGDPIADPQQPDVDNHPLGWADGTAARGPEDVDHDDDGVFDMGDAIDVTWTDSWDDSAPTNCQGANNLLGLDDDKCFDGLRNFNQSRPGVFDGGYAFGGDPAADGTFPDHLPTGYYIVQSFAPPGYKLMAEEDKNVDFGDEYVPQLLPPICVGADHVVPDLLSFVTNAAGTQVVDGDPADFASPYAGDTRPSCDAKHIRVADGKNAAADFHYLTEVPKAAHVVGGVINDLGNEFNPNAANFGEKFSPPWLPVAFYDYEGNEITRVYTDQFGKYNAMLPSTYTVNIASPSGVAPNMITACMNDAGLIDTDGDGTKDTIDPRHNPQYSQFCYVFQYMPGGTTYLDTPVQQIAAFAGSGYQLDCEIADTTPMIESVMAGALQGPYVASNSTVDRTLAITSPGTRDVPNPSASELDVDRLVTRDYGFGTVEGEAWLRPLEMWDGNASGGSDVQLLIGTGNWTNLLISAEVPDGTTPGRYQLEIVHDNTNVSQMGVTVMVGPMPLSGRDVIQVSPSSNPNANPIQDALDAARRGDVILVGPGTYDEVPIMYEPVYLQGAGALSTIINARSAPTEKVEAWRTKIESLLLDDQAFDLLPGQEIGELFVTEAGSGLTVVGKLGGSDRFENWRGRRGTFDGFTVTGGSTGGGVFLNGYIRGFQASNNRIEGNQGTFHGGVRLGHYSMTVAGDNLVNTDAQNDNVWLHHNSITRNGAQFGAGGGIALYTGAQNYRVTDNLICGNFAATDGAGIGHLGYSNNGLIEDNQIIFNQSFRQTPGFETDGGGILIAGHEGLGGELSEGAGEVRISRNLIQGNQAGAGDGGGIMLRRVSGQDVADAFDSSGSGNVHGQFDRIRIYNNTIVNNAAGGAGGAISLLDAARVDILSNTIANNISTATAGSAFEGTTPGVSTARVAGIVAHAYDAAGGVGVLIADNPGRLPGRLEVPFSNPLLRNNVVRHNRPYHYDITLPYGSQLVEETYYWDLGVAGVGGQMDPRRSLLSDATGYHSSNLEDDDLTVDPLANEYLNGAPGTNPSNPTEFTTVQAAPALDEGGNWIDVRYAPLSINDVDFATADDQPSDYHLSGGSELIDAGSTANRPNGLDIDLEPGNSGNRIDIGSDEVQQP